MSNCVTYKQQRGVSLIEVLVTILIVSTSLLALAALQTRSLQFNQGAYFRSQANIYAYDILERMRINRAELNSYVIAASASPPSGTSVSATDIGDWRLAIESNLPNGEGAIECDVSSVCTVTISWDELNSSEEATENVSVFSYSARI